MPFRDVTLPSGEVVRARVDDKAIEDWLRDRKWLRNQGRPDRPPDYDDGPTRSWLPHINAGEADHPWWQSIRAQVASLGKPEQWISEEPVVTYVWNTGALLVKLIVSERGNGSFRVRWWAHTLVDVHDESPLGRIDAPAGRKIHDYEWLVPPQWKPWKVGAFVEDRLIEIDGLCIQVAKEPVIPDVNYGRTEEHDAERDEAQADVKAEFGWADWARPLLGDQ